MTGSSLEHLRAVIAVGGLSLAAMTVSAASAQQVASVSPIQAGVAAAVRGNVRLVSVAVATATAPAVGRDVTSGDPVYLGDTVEAGPNAGLQIMLMDETIFTIGPDSAIVIDRFIYDPDKGAGKVGAKVLRGVFRFVSGRVAANEPSDMEVKLPNGVIGIRGTSAAGFVRDGVSQVVLLGPGPENNVGEPGGRIIVSGGGGNVDISRPNFGTQLTGNAPPTAPVRWDAARMGRLNSSLAPSRSAPKPPETPETPDQQAAQEGDGQPREAARQDSQQDGTAQTGTQTGTRGTPAGDRAGRPLVDGGSSITQQAGQDIGAAGSLSALLVQVSGQQERQVEKVGTEVQNIKNTLSAITTVAQLTQITNGTFNYGTVNVPFTANSSYSFSYNLNFNTRTHSGSVVVNTSTADGFAANASGTFALLHNPFTNASQTLNITEGGAGTHVPGLNSANNQIEVNYRFVNDGAIATRIEHKVKYQEPAGGSNSVSASGHNDRPQN